MEPIIEFVFRHFLGNDFRRMERKHFFGRFEFENNFKNLALLNVNILFKKFIWACRNGKIIPTGEKSLSYIINKILFFSASPINFAEDGKCQKLILLFKKICAIPNRQETGTILNLLFILVTCWVCPLPAPMWGPPPSLPPPPPLPPAASTLPAPSCG